MDRVAAARERLEAGKSLALKAREAGPPCSECRYKTLLGMCGNPAYAEMRFSPAKGVLTEAFNITVDDARADQGLCGAEGILFEPQIAPAVIGKAVISGAWLGVRYLIFGIVAFLVVAWLLR